MDYWSGAFVGLLKGIDTTDRESLSLGGASPLSPTISNAKCTVKNVE
jgi:hypothetical protein